MEKINDDLENNLNDKLISALRSFIGIIPYVGSALGEIINYFKSTNYKMTNLGKLVIETMELTEAE
jgi:hypothetical protein